MKPVFIIGLLLCFLAGCRPSLSEETVTSFQDPSPLVAVDSLMWSQPDSAFALLQEHFDPDSPYAQLLLSELLYKNNCTQNNRSELLRIVDRFNSTPFLSARAHYINGVGYYENDSVVEACREYLKALEIMEDNYREKELVGHKAKFMALTYTRLTVLFSDQYLHEQSIYFAKQSLLYYPKTDTTSWQTAWVLEAIGTSYNMLEQLDSANYYYLMAGKCLRDTNCLLSRDIDAHVQFLSYQVNGFSDTILDRFQHLLVQATSENEVLARCLSIGEIYYHEQSFDSAWIYLNRVFENTKKIGSKKQAAEWLMDICKVQQREDRIPIYADFMAPFTNQEENQSAVKSKLTEYYKNYSQKLQEWQYDEMRRNHRKLMVPVILVFLLLLLALAIYYYASTRRRIDLESMIKEEKYSHEMKQKALSERLRKSNETLRDAIKQMEGLRSQNTLSERGDKNLSAERYMAFLETTICQEVYEKVEQMHENPRNVIKTDMDVFQFKSFALSATQMSSLFKNAESHFPDLYVSLKTIYPALNSKDWCYCLLYLMQLDKLDICVLLQVSYHSCRRHTLKLERAFHCKQGLKMFLVDQVVSL